VLWLQNGLGYGYRAAASKGPNGISSNITWSLWGRHDYATFHINHWRLW
jgi:hypothetical protein